ncbi:MAG: HNH endonuclease signature motif containing protein [Candidatus Acidiferrales bacterium]
MFNAPPFLAARYLIRRAHVPPQPRITNRSQARVVDAAHILPVGAPGSVDHVRNGIALSPTYHRAFDASLIYLDERRRMLINEGQLHILDGLHLAGGAEVFQRPLGTIFLPPDPDQRPSVDFIRRANSLRQINA